MDSLAQILASVSIKLRLIVLIIIVIEVVDRHLWNCIAESRHRKIIGVKMSAQEYS